MANISLGKYFDKKEEIFKDATVFDNSYCPKKPIERKEVPEIMQRVADFMRLGVAEHLFIGGKHGFGKTLYGKYLSGEIKSVAAIKGKKIRVEYRNCRDYKDEASLLTNLCELDDDDLEYENLHQHFCQKLKSDFILILDEVDMMSGSDDLLYFLTRISETHSVAKYRIQLILISNKIDWDRDIDNATRSSLNLTKIIFNEYTKTQIRDILKQRIRIGLISDAIIPDKLLNSIVEKTINNNTDLRVAIKALFILCKEIEKAGISKINEGYLQNIYEKAIRSIQSERIAGLDDTKLTILYAVARSKNPSVRNIYETDYRNICIGAKKRILGYTRFNFYLKVLQDQNMITMMKDKKHKTLFNTAKSKVNEHVLEVEYENRKILSTRYNI